MITKVTVESFKSLESLEIELGQVNVFVGANGSGKSNLLEAVGVLGAASFGRVDDESLLRRGVRPGLPQLYKSAFPHKRSERRPHIFFGAENSTAKYEVSLWNPIKDPNPAWRFKTESLRRSTGENIVDRAPFRKPAREMNPEQGFAALKSVELKENDPARQLLELLRGYSIYSANTPTLRGMTLDQQNREPVGLSGGRLPEAISELGGALRKEDNEWLKRAAAEIRPELIDWANAFGSAAADTMPLSASAAASRRVVRFRDRFMTPKRNILSGYDASEGALYVIFASVLILHPRSPSFFAIDNVDQSLNPVLAKKLSAAICRWTLDAPHPKQVLLTSHNPTVLDGLPLADDRVRLFTVDRDNRGHTAVKRVLPDRELLERATEGWTLSRLWANGLIGGVPDV
jgi:predicted ATPase